MTFQPMPMPKAVAPAELARRLDGFKAASRRAGLKVTQQRLEIFREVASSLEHPDAEAVTRAIRARLPTVSPDTVYRTLALLGELGLVIPLGPRRESVRFDANLARHHHYVCLRCGLTRDFASPALDGLRLPGAVKDLGSVLAMQIEVRGLCATCARAGTARRSAGAGDTRARRPRGVRRARWTAP
jgi:Fur family peroxide stress response transcriptional regulator